MLFPDDIESFAADLDQLDSGGTARLGGGRALLLELTEYYVASGGGGQSLWSATASLTTTEDGGGPLLTNVDVWSPDAFHHELAAKLRSLLATDPWPLDETWRRPLPNR